MNLSKPALSALMITLALQSPAALASKKCFKDLRPDTIGAKMNYENCSDAKELINAVHSLFEGMPGNCKIHKSFYPSLLPDRVSRREIFGVGNF